LGTQLTTATAHTPSVVFTPPPTGERVQFSAEVGAAHREVKPISFAGAISPVASVSEFTVWIGDAKFVVPRQFYARGEYWDVLPTETSALNLIWPIQTMYRDVCALTDGQLDGLWACVDLQPDQGYFFRTEQTQGLSGYAGRMFYWVTQYLAMFWSFTADGEGMGGTSPCSGISCARPYLFESGVAGPRWHVVAGSTGKEGGWYYGYAKGDWTYCDPSHRPATSRRDCGSLDSTILDDYGSPLLPSNARELRYVSRSVPGWQAVRNARSSCGSDDEQIGVYGVDDPSSDTLRSAVGGAFVPDYCTVYLSAALIGGRGRVADLLLHWAHVAAALASTVEDPKAAASYRNSALLLGRYAAVEVVELGRLIAHELGHAYTFYASDSHDPSHEGSMCCMCGVAYSWSTGVTAYLGLPRGGSGYYAYTTYTEEDRGEGQGCSDDGEADVYFDYIAIYDNPTRTLQSRYFRAWGCRT